MNDCPYGECRMRNLCKYGHCVRSALEKDGYDLQPDGALKERAPMKKQPDIIE